MFSLTSSNIFLLYRHPTDMRKCFDGLCGVITSGFSGNPRSGQVFIFVNKRRDRMKLLHWEAGGFTLYYKRLERGTFELPDFHHSTREISWPELAMMVGGISIKNIHRRKRFYPHQIVSKTR